MTKIVRTPPNLPTVTVTVPKNTPHSVRELLREGHKARVLAQAAGEPDCERALALAATANVVAPGGTPPGDGALRWFSKDHDAHVRVEVEVAP